MNEAASPNNPRRGGHPAAQGARMRAPTGRRSIRLPNYDYSSAGAYFVTACTKDRRPLLANERLARFVGQAWNWLPNRFPGLTLDEFIIMPDHVHFVVLLLDPGDHERSFRDRRGGHPAAQKPPPLGTVVGAFKTVASRSINASQGTRGQSVWQRNYYEHVVRSEEELTRIREYIKNNPLQAHVHQSDDLREAWSP